MIPMDLSIHSMSGSLNPADLLTRRERRIYDPIRSRIQILGIRSRDPFLGSTHKYATSKPRHWAQLPAGRRRPLPAIVPTPAAARGRSAGR